MRSISRRSWITAAGLLLGLLGSEVRAQVVPADRLDLPPTDPSSNGFVLQGSQSLLHTWDAGASLGQTTNLYLGRLAGNVDLANNTGRENTGIGPFALSSVTSGGANTAVGNAAMQGLRDGGMNTAVGYWAMAGNTSGSSNSAVGAFSLIYNTTGSSNVAIGGLTYNSTGSYNTAVGGESLYESTTGWGNTAVGYRTMLGNQNGYTNTAVGYQANVAKPDLFNATAIGAGAVATTKNMVRIGNSAVTLIQGQVPFSWVSDRRWKVDVEPLALGLDFMRELRPVSYRLKGGNGRLDLGFVAQDVEEIVGEGYNLVARGGDDEQLLSMRYTDLVAPMVKALQELDARQRAQEESLATVRNENAALSRQVESLRARLDALGEPRR